MLTGSQLFLVSLAALLCQSGAIPNGYSSMVINGGRNIDTEDYGGSSYVPYPLLDSETADIRPKRESPPIVKPSPQVYSLAITSNIRYRYAETLISNRVANPLNVSQEISFTVTLPESAFISKFLMIVKDKVYEAYVKEKEEARKDYQAAVDRGESAGHVELSARDSNVFTVSVNVEALNKVTFNLTYEQLLKRTLGLYENVITINPGQIVKSLLVQVNIEESSNITVLEVPDLKTNNEIDDSAATVNKLAVIERPATNKAQITWSPTSEQQAQISESGPHGQFIVRYDVDRKSHPSQILIDEGYFVHFYAPTDLKTLRKHVVFTLDVSGSMQGRKIEQLKEALLQILSDISETDFFTIILFSDSVQLWTLNGTYGETVSRWTYYEEPTTTSTTTTARPESELNKEFIIPATPENVAKAKEFAKTINDTGGTNIIAALRKSLDISKWGQKNKADGAQPIIIFLTDGQPNVELSDTEEIIKAVRKQNTDKYALFSLAFGDGADYNFLRKLSLSSNGFARNIYVASDTALQLKNFYKEVASPLLADVSFQYLPGQVQENTTTREKFSNLFAGSELVVAGKLSSDVETLSGNITGIDAELAICYFPMPPIITLPPPIETIVNKTYGHLEKLWAYLYIQELLDKDAISDEKNSTYKQKALELSLQYSFVTPLTSLVVVKPNETVSQGLGKEPIPEFESLLAPHRLSQGYAAAAPAGMYGSAAAPTFIAAQHKGGPLLMAMPPLPHPALSSTPPHPSYDAVDDTMQQPIPIRFETYATTSLIHDHTVYEPSQPRYLNLTDIAWLNGTTEVKYPSSNITYSIAPSDLPNAAYQICLSPNDKSQGHCRHLAHCVLAAITVSFEDFIPFGEQCVIDARFVGICCPDVASIPDASSTPPATSTDDGSTAQTTGVTL